jgi:hypothetical protein
MLEERRFVVLSALKEAEQSVLHGNNVTPAILRTPLSRVIFKKLIVAQPVKKFLAFYGNSSFTTMFT